MEPHLPLAVSEPANGFAVSSSPRRLQCKLNEPQRSKNDEEREKSRCSNSTMEMDIDGLISKQPKNAGPSQGSIVERSTRRSKAICFGRRSSKIEGVRIFSSSSNFSEAKPADNKPPPPRSSGGAQAHHSIISTDASRSSCNLNEQYRSKNDEERPLCSRCSNSSMVASVDNASPFQQSFASVQAHCSINPTDASQFDCNFNEQNRSKIDEE